MANLKSPSRKVIGISIIGIYLRFGGCHLEFPFYPGLRTGIESKKRAGGSRVPISCRPGR
jgi:hypothetical protein